MISKQRNRKEVIYIISNRIKELRKARSLTQETLAKEINETFNTNIERSMLSKWENNAQQPVMSTVFCLAEFFGVTTDYLMGHSNERVSKKSIRKTPSLTNEQQKGNDEMQDIQQAQISRDLGRRIAQARKAEGMTLEDLSKATDIHTSTLCRYERGEIVRIKLPIIKSIAEATKTEVNWLLYGVSGEVDHVTHSGTQEKLIFVSKRLSANNVVRVTLEKEAAEIINNIWLQTGLPATYLVSRMIEFAAERVEIEKTAFDDED